MAAGQASGGWPQRMNDKAFRVYAKLGRSGAGTHERGVFMPASDLLALAPAIKAQTGQTSPMLEPGKVSGARCHRIAAPVRASLASFRHQGHCGRTGIRQGVTALLGGAVALVAMMFASTALLEHFPN